MAHHIHQGDIAIVMRRPTEKVAAINYFRAAVATLDPRCNAADNRAARSVADRIHASHWKAFVAGGHPIVPMAAPQDRGQASVVISESTKQRLARKRKHAKAPNDARRNAVAQYPQRHATKERATHAGNLHLH